MPEINCDKIQCPMNKPYRRHRRCTDVVMSYVDGKCEFFEANKEKETFKEVKESDRN